MLYIVEPIMLKGKLNLRSPFFALTIILALAALLRLAGVAYGLPFWLVDDEPPFILAALKMLELKTALPFLHATDFQTILYYPPSLSYLFLIPFAPLAGAKPLFFAGPASP